MGREGDEKANRIGQYLVEKVDVTFPDTERQPNEIRIISAREATRAERKYYEQSH